MNKPTNCTRYRTEYRGMNLYIIVDESKIILNMENSDEFRTLAGLSLVESLFNELLEDRNLEELAGMAFENSYRKDDLPMLINNAIMWHLDGKNVRRL